ncbi:unnamed protein product [Penicillium salamii]|uniref:Elongation of fatty acids protein n=1 Tax=Penicillium salamii TaxID=1612424 RepID=A0A9W4JUK5_9EURO|nr:unnamed protein product [Penicillium salamii]
MNTFSGEKPIQVGLPPLESFWPSIGQPYKVASSFFSESPDTSTLLRPISVSPATYRASLDFQVPFTFAIGYVTTVLFLNRLNVSRQGKPWAFSKNPVFKAFVVLHNASLAVFSAWVLYGMGYSMYASWPTGATKEGPDYHAHVAQMFCATDANAIQGKMNPSVYLIPSLECQYLTSSHMTASANVKSLWDEGSAYFGWFFYMSKFYEVLDTMIILSSGKKSSTLQTYHHAGVILCAWASLRYTSPSYVVPVVFNSAVHTLMYSYFAMQSLGVSIPMAIKRSLTVIQIAQFLIGLVWLYVPVFLKYNISSVMTPQAFSNVSLSELAPRLVHAAPSRDFCDETEKFAADTAVSCLTDRGQALAVAYSTIYILPLLVLFVQFFIRSYMKARK